MAEPEKHFSVVLETLYSIAQGHMLTLQSLMNETNLVSDTDDPRCAAASAEAAVLADIAGDLRRISESLGLSHIADARMIHLINSRALQGDAPETIRLREEGERIRRAHFDEAFKIGSSLGSDEGAPKEAAGRRRNAAKASRRDDSAKSD